jgi:hypothetical protein
MAAIHETAYPRLKPNPDEQELKQNFLPTQAEIALLKTNTSERSPHRQRKRHKTLIRKFLAIVA